ncbi:MAG: hypothetical protein COX19_10705 [Desulfobacterales bacterium CG23_combo_of_CG06-09_8_20_14_all_51_8]|nr:MAG: hypothetical protein COX19_10705 [Desulfobacterales bacterium CG23_combo_of_CG06-09_8_20_14_all_51_8]
MQVDPDDSIDPSNENQIIKKTHKIKRWLWNMISSGLPADYDLEALRKIFLLNLMIFLGSFFLILLGAIEFILHDHLLALVNWSFLLFVMWLFIYLRKTKNYIFISLIGTTIAGVFYFFLIAYGGIGNTAYMWLFTYPLIAIFLLGARKGTVFSLILLVSACVVFTLGTRIAFFASYDPFLKIRFVSAYLTIYLLSFIT